MLAFFNVPAPTEIYAAALGDLKVRQGKLLAGFTKLKPPSPGGDQLDANGGEQLAGVVRTSASVGGQWAVETRLVLSTRRRRHA